MDLEGMSFGFLRFLNAPNSCIRLLSLLLIPGMIIICRKAEGLGLPALESEGVAAVREILREMHSSSGRPSGGPHPDCNAIAESSWHVSHLPSDSTANDY